MKKIILAGCAALFSFLVANAQIPQQKRDTLNQHKTDSLDFKDKNYNQPDSSLIKRDSSDIDDKRPPKLRKDSGVMKK